MPPSTLTWAPVSPTDTERPVFGTAIESYGVRIGIRSDRPRELENLTDLLPPLWKPHPGTTVDRRFSILFDDSKVRLEDDQEESLDGRDLEATLSTFRLRTKMFVAEKAPAFVFVHAGVVGWRDRAIVIPGRTYTGKTTLVAALVRAGATYYSDEYAVLDSSGQVHPYPQALGIRDRATGRQTDRTAASFGADTGTEPLPIGRVVAAPYEEAATWAPESLSQGRGVLALLDNTVPARHKPDEVLATLTRALANATILSGERGEADPVARALLDSRDS